MPDAVVVDASIAVKWIVPEFDSPFALALLERWQEASVILVAPCWFPSELANAVFKQVLRGNLAFPRARLLLDGTVEQFALLDPIPGLAGRALEIAHELGQKATYDCQYLALAEHLDCELWTADERFWNAAKGKFPRVRWVGEVSLSPGAA